MTPIKRIPLALSGLMLSCFALANLLRPTHAYLHTGLSRLGMVLCLLITLKIIFNAQGVLEDLKHPVISSVLPTYTMALMLLAVYLKPHMGQGSLYLWYGAIGLHVLLMVNYSLRQLLAPKLGKIFPSIFVVFVGIAVASVSAPAFNQPLGQAAFYFALIAYGITLPLVVTRLIRLKEMPGPAQPTLAIMAAPSSLLLAGYLSAFTSPHTYAVYILLSFSLVMYFFVLTKMPKLLSLSFTPGFAAYTFPMVISAVAIKKASVFLDKAILQKLATGQLLIASLLLFYVLVRYILFSLQSQDA